MHTQSLPFILLANGASITLRHPNPKALDLPTVAHALAQINRFTGHCRRPYSVAEHSLLVAQIIENAGGCALAQMAALMHDAHEALVGDATSPLKAAMRRVAASRSFVAEELPHAKAWSDFDRLEHGAAAAVHEAFGLVKAFAVFGADIGRADMVALATERRDLMPASDMPWDCLAGVQPLPSADLMSALRIDARWNDWRDAFIDRFEQLHTQLLAQPTPGYQPLLRLAA